ncbi:MAG: LutC/YkgG family protein [Longimicrobiales bacterium]|jgi:L-lactate dehydrogenase complex protein LldG
MNTRDQILTAIRAARERRTPVEHPGRFGGWRPVEPPPPLEGFEAMFTQAGGEVVHVSGTVERDDWLRTFLAEFQHLSMGAGVPPGIADLGPTRINPGDEHAADVGVSMARGAIAETGSLMMDARDGRRAQLLPPVLVVLVDRSTVHATVADAFESARGDLSAAIGLHSGPSKSADIGQVMVKGVHGPGRVIAVLA